MDGTARDYAHGPSSVLYCALEHSGASMELIHLQRWHLDKLMFGSCHRRSSWHLGSCLSVSAEFPLILLASLHARPVPPSWYPVSRRPLFIWEKIESIGPFSPWWGHSSLLTKWTCILGLGLCSLPRVALLAWPLLESFNAFCGSQQPICQGLFWLHEEESWVEQLNQRGVYFPSCNKKPRGGSPALLPGTMVSMAPAPSVFRLLHP